MKINRGHALWAFLVAVATFVTGLFYLANFSPEHLPVPMTLPAMLVGSSRVDLQACKLEYSIVSPK